MPQSFGTRLRRHRERQHIDLASIAAETKIALPLLEGLEADNVSHWPSGIFRRAFIRAYAQAIGLQPDEVVREFLERGICGEIVDKNAPYCASQLCAEPEEW